MDNCEQNTCIESKEEITDISGTGGGNSHDNKPSIKNNQEDHENKSNISVSSDRQKSTEIRAEAVFVEKKSGYYGITMKDVPKPIPDDGEIVVQVIAVGLNFEDLLARNGLIDGVAKSFIPCFECSGFVHMTGTDVTNVSIGDRVIIIQPLGCCSRFLKVKANHCYKIPDKMSLHEAAAFSLNYITAYILLFYYANIRNGESVLIHNVGGGVGLAALQLASLIKDVSVIGTASKFKQQTLEKLGLKKFIDYRNKNYIQEILNLTDKKGVDIILNPLGGKEIKKNEVLLKSLGRYLVYGESSKIKGERKCKKKSSTGEIKYNHLLQDNKIIGGFNIISILTQHNFLSYILNKLFNYFNEGLIRPRIDTVFHANRMGDAQRYITERKNIGKVLVVFDNNDIIFRSTDMVSDDN